MLIVKEFRKLSLLLEIVLFSLIMEKKQREVDGTQIIVCPV